MTELEQLRENYHGVYRMWYGVPILVTWDKLEPQAPCPECRHTVHTRECVFHGQR